MTRRSHIATALARVVRAQECRFGPIRSQLLYLAASELRRAGMHPAALRLDHAAGELTDHDVVLIERELWEMAR